MLKRGELQALGFYDRHHPFYLSWCNMKTRCDSPKSTQYAYYGGRGIHYCEEWKSFRAFYDDMWPTWERGKILDRRENNLGYNKDNCRWIHKSESSRNRRSNILTREDAESIRRLYEGGGISQETLGERFRVSQAYISNILAGKSWN